MLRWLRGLLAFLALAILAWAFHFGSSEPGGFANSSFYSLLAIALVLMAFAGTIRTPYGTAMAWLALAAVGQAIALQLIDAGKLVRYQHWRPAVQPPTEADIWMLVALAIQAILVVGGLRSPIKAIWRWAHAHFGLFRSVLAILIFAGLSASPSKNLTVFGTELLLASLFKAVQLGNVLLVVSALPPETLARFGNHWRSFFASNLLRSDWSALRLDRFVILAVIWVACVSAFLNWTVWERHPHIPDEVGYLYHARYFAQGNLSAPAPPVREAFEVFQISCDQQKCIGVMAPGWPAMLAVGTRFGVPWLVNPLLGGLNVILLYLLMGGLYEKQIARLAVLLFCVSPWNLFLSMSYMTHTFTLTGALLAALGCVRMWRSGKLRWGIVAGVGTGLASLVRPLDGVVVAGVLGLALLFVKGRRFRFSPLLTLTVAALLTGALVLPYNQAVSGSAARFPVMGYLNQLWGEGSNYLGFGSNRGMFPLWPGLDGYAGHSPFEAVVNAELNVTALEVELLGWGIGSLLPIVLFLLSGTLSRSDGWMVVAIGAIVGLYSLYWFAGGPDFGPRYWFLILIPAIALTARGLDSLGRLVGVKPGDSIGYGRVGIAVAALVGMALLNFFPWRAVDKYYRYWGMTPEIRELLVTQNFDNGLILVRGASQPDFTSAMTYNPLDLRSQRPIFAHDSSPEVRKRLLAAYADRPVWILDGPTRTGNRYRIVAGPLTHDSFIGRQDTE